MSGGLEIICKANNLLSRAWYIQEGGELGKRTAAEAKTVSPFIERFQCSVLIGQVSEYQPVIYELNGRPGKQVACLRIDQPEEGAPYYTIEEQSNGLKYHYHPQYTLKECVTNYHNVKQGQEKSLPKTIKTQELLILKTREGLENE